MKTLLIIVGLLVSGCSLRTERREIPSVWSERFAQRTEILEVLLRGMVREGDRIVVVAPDEIVSVLAASDLPRGVVVESAEGLTSRKNGYYDKAGRKVDLVFTFSSLEVVGGQRLVVRFGEHFIYDSEVLWEVELLRSNGKWRVVRRKELLVS